ncbi:MAG: hypothetical protein ACKVX9_14545 [Blastocatellia bacterium]
MSMEKGMTIRRFLMRGALLGLSLIIAPRVAAAFTSDPLYFSFKAEGPLAADPSSLLIQSPTYISVPAGAVLSVFLMRGDALVSTSRLSFPTAYENTQQLPPVPIATFVPPGMPTSVGQPLPGASLVAGNADLARFSSEAGQYRLIWRLSAGVMGTPGLAILTGFPHSLIELKLSAISTAVRLGDQKPGSVLFFNRYTSSASNPSREDTTLNLTNTSPSAAAFVRLFLVNGSTCQPQEQSICLAAQQTISFQMSDLDPGVKGYVVVVATNAAGEPTQFNYLIGNAIVKQPAANIGGTFASSLPAIAIARRKDGDVRAGVNNEAEMIFDDVNYDRLPAQSAVDGVPSQANAANSSTISIYRPMANLGGGVANAAIQLTGWGTGTAGQVVTSAGSLSTACYGDFAVSSLRLTPVAISQLLPSGKTAWFAISTADLQPLMAAHLNSGQYNSGGNARALSYSAEYRIRIPVVAVACP